MISQETLELFREEYNQILNAVKTDSFEMQQTFEQQRLHSEKVVENILLLGQSLDMEDGEMRMAELLGLFHDIARFSEFSQSPYFGEIARTEHHAERGAELIAQLPPFKELEAAKQEILQKVILYHNKRELPKRENEFVIYYLKLLRDADKLDALRMTSEFLTYRDIRVSPADRLNLSKRPTINEQICKAIMNDLMPQKEDIVTFNDYVLLQLAWVFELTYRKTYQILNQKQYVKRLYDALPKNDCTIEIYRKARIHIENQLFQ